eukprot:3078403-Rhodomonas_salina.2
MALQICSHCPSILLLLLHRLRSSHYLQCGVAVCYVQCCLAIRYVQCGVAICAVLCCSNCKVLCCHQSSVLCSLRASSGSQLTRGWCCAAVALASSARCSAALAAPCCDVTTIWPHSAVT